MTAAAATKPLRPLWSKVVLEIYRTDHRRLRVERVKWAQHDRPVMQLVVVRLSRDGLTWYHTPPSMSIRPNECRRVAEALMQVAG